MTTHQSASMARASNPGTPILHIVSGNNTVNLDSTILQPFDELFGTVEPVSNTTYYSVNLATAEIRFNVAGFYELTAHWDFSTAGARNIIRVGVYNAGNLISPYSQNNYVRAATGANESSDEIPGFPIGPVPAGYTIQLQRQRIAGNGAGTQVLQSNNSYVYVKRIETL